MSQTVITTSFEQWKARQAVSNEPVLLDEFVFANIPGLDPSLPVSRAEVLPAAGLIVHRQAVTRTGVVNANRVAYSVVLGADTGDFDFNWIGLVNRESNTLAMVVHAPVQQKLKTKAGQQGNVLTRSFLMEYIGAATQTEINTPAETWQIDFTARLSGVDERQRVENTDVYGQAAFFGDGWLVTRSGADYVVNAGVGYVAGLRVVLPANKVITPIARPYRVYVDASFSGQLTSAWQVVAVPVVSASLADYDQGGVHHYVFPVAQVNADGSVTDMRPVAGGVGDYLRRDRNLSDIQDADKARHALGLGSTQVPYFTGLELRSSTPFIDFHFSDNAADYTDRIIALADGLHITPLPGRFTTLDSDVNIRGLNYANAFRAASPATPDGQGVTIDWNGLGSGMAGFTNNQGAGTGGFVFRTVNTTNTIEFGRVTFTQDGQIKASRALWAGEATYAVDGNAYGTMWGVNGAADWLSNYLNTRFNAIPVNNTTGDVKGTAWGGSLAVYLSLQLNTLLSKINAIPVDNLSGNIKGSAWGNDWLSNYLTNKFNAIQNQFNAIPVNNTSGDVKGTSWGGSLYEYLAAKFLNVQSQIDAVPIDRANGNLRGTLWEGGWLSVHLSNLYNRLKALIDAVPVDNPTGNIHGTAWGNDWLSNYIDRRFAATRNQYTIIGGNSSQFKDVTSGLIIQTGWIESNSGAQEVGSFNYAFPNGCVAVISTMGVTINSGNTVYTSVGDKYSFYYKTSGARMGFTWLAIGY